MQLIKKGATSRILLVYIEDASKSDGSGLTGLVYDSAGLTAYYHRDSAASATSITLATMTLGTYTSGGFKEVDAANMPGWYQFCPPDAALAGGATAVCLELRGAANMTPCVLAVQLCDEEPGQLAAGAITAAVIAANAIDDDALAADLDVYSARIDFRRDAANSRDEYTVGFAKNGVPITSGVTSPTLTVTNRSGTVLISAAALTEIGTTEVFCYNTTSAGQRQTMGDSCIVAVAATIDGSSRSFRTIDGRDF
jgi:hypothetical protein